MLRSLFFFAALCFPTALDAQTNGASPGQIGSLETDMHLVKQKFLELLADMDVWTDRIRALEVENHRLKERLAELETGGRVEDLSNRVAILEGHVMQENFVAQMEDSNEKLQSLSVRVELLEVRIDASQVGSPGGGLVDNGTGAAISPLPQSFVARTDESGRLISIYRREIDTSQAKILVAETDCETVGEWFEESFATRDYNAFFIRSDRGVRVCEKLNQGWRSLRVGETRRAHVITEPL